MTTRDITLILSKQEASDLRAHLCSSYNGWMAKSHCATDEQDRQVCELLARQALSLFSLCMLADHTLEIREEASCEPPKSNANCA